MTKKYLLFSLEDNSAKKLAGILGNKTCKKIIDILAEKEASEKDLADELGIPINTVEYNLKKLLDAQIIEKTKNFFWSQKGKKIDMYKLSNKSIIISTKAKKVSQNLKSVLPVAIISGLGALIVRQYFLMKQVVQKSDAVFGAAQESIASTEVARAGGEIFITASIPSAWLWFLGGALFALLVFSIIQLVKGGKNNG